MVSPEATDVFFYDILCYGPVRKTLLAREFESRPALLNGFRVEIAPERPYCMIFPAEGIVYGEIVVVTGQELSLVGQFMNRPDSRRKYNYDFIQVEVDLPDPKGLKSERLSDVLTPAVSAESLIVVEALPRAGLRANPSSQEIEALLAEAEMVRARYLESPATQEPAIQLISPAERLLSVA